MAARSFLGAGDVYIDRIVNGVHQGLQGPFYADKVEVKPSVDTKESTSKGRYDYGQVLETVNVPKPTEFSLDLSQITGDVLAMAFLGTSAAVTEAPGTLTEQVVTMKLGAWVDIGHANLADLITVEHGTGTGNYTEGVDYKLNRPMGWIMALSTGAIADASTVKISGAYAGRTGTKIAGSTLTEVRARIVFDGINQADGSQVTADFYETVLSADSAFDFLADSFGKVSLKGQLKTPDGASEPYSVVTQPNAA